MEHNYDYYRNVNKNGMSLLNYEDNYRKGYGDDIIHVSSGGKGLGSLLSMKNIALVGVGAGLAYMYFNRNQTIDPATGLPVTTQLTATSYPVFIVKGDADNIAKLSDTLVAIYGPTVVSSGYANTSTEVAFEIDNEDEETFYMQQAQNLGLTVAYGTSVALNNAITGQTVDSTISTNTATTTEVASTPFPEG